MGLPCGTTGSLSTTFGLSRLLALSLPSWGVDHTRREVGHAWLKSGSKQKKIIKNISTKPLNLGGKYFGSYHVAAVKEE